MTTETLAAPPPSVVPAPSARQLNTPARVLGAIAQLAALGILGSVVFGALATLLALGLGLLPVLGIGLLFLLGFIYALFALGWLETARVSGLYSLGIPPLSRRRRQKPGFSGFLRMVWQQFIDVSMWRAVASFAISAILGFVVLALLSSVGHSIALAFAPLYRGAGTSSELWGSTLAISTEWAPLVGIVMALAALAGVVGIAVLHGVIARAVVVPSLEAHFAEQARTSSEQRAGAIRASEVERTRIERDLHDGVQPRLVSIGMTLGMAQQKIDDDPEAAKALVSEAHTSTKAAITDLRQLARGIHASVLDDRGLDAALSALAGRSHIPVHLDVRLDGRCSKNAEAAVYFVVAETLTNAAKHSRASEARVVVRLRDTDDIDGAAGQMLWARVEDNGIGGARVVPGGGLDGITNRVLAAGGTARLESPIGGPTSLEVNVPCAS
ncbi:signal transduction histidine kinase [Microbacterium endophyticum]|uniref:histidine kinase n=1 Tax=Microbacterium endophyticum TaxID=1526412 RepID=A0A7W4V323_9MICO|nr:histidine kinase [Microbacterium endophyticum]MBB2975942.1 signal transduction histidine kinase [Microbacterium endophyticum]NIK37689.1 signal transduction histidine kinase [Microbacterium endophyticum]